MNARPSYGGGPELRIGDAERERAATLLADHYAAGRITQEEHGERLDRIWAARTSSEIAPVFADLPGPAHAASPGPMGPSVQPPRPGRGRWSALGRLPWPLAVALVVLAVVVGLAHLPLVLVGLGVWFFFLRGGGCGSARRRGHAWGGPHGHRRW